MMERWRRHGPLFLGLFGFLLVAGLGRFVSFGNADAARYEMLARNLLRGEYSACPAPPYLPEFERMPGYPLFLALAHTLFGDGRYAVTLAQAFLHGATAVLLFSVARVITGRRAIAWVAAIFWIFDPFALYYALNTFSEYLSAFLVTASFAGLLGYVKGRRWGLALACVSAVAAAFVRPNLMVLPGGVLFFALFQRIPQRRRILAGTAAMTSAIALALVPWTIRNYVHFDKVIIGAHQFLGMNMCQAAVQFQIPLEQMDDYCFAGVRKDILNECDWRRSLESDQLLKAHAHEFVEQHPTRVAMAGLVRPFRLWFSLTNSSASAESRSTRARLGELAMGVGTLALFPFFVVGLFALWRRFELGFLPGAACLVISSMHVLLYVSGRYAMPLRPLYVLAVSTSLVLLWGTQLVAPMRRALAAMRLGVARKFSRSTWGTEARR